MRKPARKIVAPSSAHTGQRGAPAVPRLREADPEPAHDDPDEQRVEERHRREDVAVVEEPQRRRRREQEEQVEVAQRERPPPVREPDEEDEAERAPDPRVVDRRAAERAGRAARHPPRDLRAGPGLRHAAASRRRTLPCAISPALAPPDLHRPARRLRVVRLLVAAARVRVAREPGRDLRVALEDARARSPASAAPAAAARGANGVWTRCPLPSKTGAVGAVPVAAERRGSGDEDGERGEGGGEENPHAIQATQRVARRNDQSLLPTKLSGVTSTIATPAPTSLPSPP